MPWVVITICISAIILLPLREWFWYHHHFIRLRDIGLRSIKYMTHVWIILDLFPYIIYTSGFGINELY